MPLSLAATILMLKADIIAISDAIGCHIRAAITPAFRWLIFRLHYGRQLADISRRHYAAFQMIIFAFAIFDDFRPCRLRFHY